MHRCFVCGKRIWWSPNYIRWTNGRTAYWHGTHTSQAVIDEAMRIVKAG